MDSSPQVLSKTSPDHQNRLSRCARRSDDTEARTEALRCFGRSDRSERRLISGGERRIPRYSSWASGYEDRGMLIADAQRDSRTVYVFVFAFVLLAAHKRGDALEAAAPRDLSMR